MKKINYKFIAYEYMTTYTIFTYTEYPSIDIINILLILKIEYNLLASTYA